MEYIWFQYMLPYNCYMVALLKLEELIAIDTTNACMYVVL